MYTSLDKAHTYCIVQKITGILVNSNVAVVLYCYVAMHHYDCFILSPWYVLNVV